MLKKPGPGVKRCVVSGDGAAASESHYEPRYDCDLGLWAGISDDTRNCGLVDGLALGEGGISVFDDMVSHMAWDSAQRFCDGSKCDNRAHVPHDKRSTNIAFDHNCHVGDREVLRRAACG